MGCYGLHIEDKASNGSNNWAIKTGQGRLITDSEELRLMDLEAKVLRDFNLGCFDEENECTSK